jgi:hypothetical protein
MLAQNRLDDSVSMDYNLKFLKRKFEESRSDDVIELDKIDPTSNWIMNIEEIAL